MAEINNDSNSGDSKNIRSKKLSSKVDLTAMVDLAFLLITFFMLTTSLTEPRAMDLIMPDANGKPSAVDENTTLTVLIGENNTLKCYFGMLGDKLPTDVKQGKDLRTEIAKRKLQVADYAKRTGNANKKLTVLIKPSKKSNYRSLVDVLDEMAISNVPTYAITDLQPEEFKFLTPQVASR